MNIAVQIDKPPYLFPSEWQTVQYLQNLGFLYEGAYWTEDARRTLIFLPMDAPPGEYDLVEANSLDDFYAEKFDELATGYREAFSG